MASGIWALLVSGLAALLACGQAGLKDAGKAATLCLAAATLEKELASVTVDSPGGGLAREELNWAAGDGRRFRCRARQGRLELQELLTGQTRVLAAGIDAAVFHVRVDDPRVVRYFLASEGRCLLSSSLARAGRRGSP
jgi:hypothetical protein